MAPGQAQGSSSASGGTALKFECTETLQKLSRGLTGTLQGPSTVFLAQLHKPGTHGPDLFENRCVVFVHGSSFVGGRSDHL